MHEDGNRDENWELGIGNGEWGMGMVGVIGRQASSYRQGWKHGCLVLFFSVCSTRFLKYRAFITISEQWSSI